MSTALKCPACGDERVHAQQRAFVSQEISLLPDGTIAYEPWTTEDVDFTDAEWYVCRSCGEHAESIDRFRTPQG